MTEVNGYSDSHGSTGNGNNDSNGHAKLKKPNFDVEEALQNIKDMYNILQYRSKPPTNRKKFTVATDEAIQNILFSHVIDRRLHRDYFHAQLRFIRGLTSISTMLVNLNLGDKDFKNYALRLALKKLNRNKDFIKGVYIPIFSPTVVPYRVVRIPHAEAVCLNSRTRVPYMLNLEVVSGIVEQSHVEAQKKQKKTDNNSTSLQESDLPIDLNTPQEGSESEQPETDTKVTKLGKIFDEWVVIKEGKNLTY